MVLSYIEYSEQLLFDFYILYFDRMEKLIWYLNDYLDDWQEWLYACYPLDDDFDKFFHTKDWEWTIEEAQVISKRFWFIQRLLDNDKIAYRRCLDLWYEIAVIDEEWEDIDVMRTFDSYEQLLMYLAIQDNPIEFLVSILK